ncbi:MAG: tRNA(Ile)-lysidine synthase [Actinomycetota bacterium]|jgi:tRNA(Ile)-lysidine synthase|nr:tRNA(Ile)-lysidine synthase [Actinomycetota bacterium]
MTGPPAATAAVRVAVRRALADVTGPVAAAVSGGADSLALAAALAFERPGSFAFVVDHRLQDGSAEVAARAAEQCRGLGLDAQVHSRATKPAAARGGPEAAARTTRYLVLEHAARHNGVEVVLLGHTLDDQAETVLLGLARGSGARALAGMPADRGIFRRPLLGLSRDVTAKACAEAGLVPWADPHNDDPAFARVRVRSRVLPVLEDELGPGIAEALARSAAQLREDADALDALTPELPDEASCDDLAVLVPAVRARALKRWAERLAGTAVTSVHVDALRALVEAWSGQGPVDLPGGVSIRRTEGRLVRADG